MFKYPLFFRPGLVILLFLSAEVWSLSDPTRPSGYHSVAPEKQGLRLESILFSESRKVAVINGKVVAEGDSIGRTKIIQISRDSVTVSRDGKSKKIELKRTSIRQEN
ncbi:MAG TPA: hypothetical protein ENI05_11415 [Porticoccus sp.]|nr:hypothetical protein [Porticoccus sp.]